MTVASIRELLRDLIDQPSTAIWSNAKLNRLIFSEYRDLIGEITDRWPDYYTTNSSVSTTANVEYTDLPTDCTVPKKLIDSEGYTLKWIPNCQFNHTSAATEPSYFDVIGRHIWWNPKPDTVYTYTLYYHYQPTDLSLEGSVPELPTGLHDILAYAAAINSKLAKEENINDYQQKYDRKLELLLRRVGKTQTNNARRVVRIYDENDE